MRYYIFFRNGQYAILENCKNSNSALKYSLIKWPKTFDYSSNRDDNMSVLDKSKCIGTFEWEDLK